MRYRDIHNDLEYAVRFQPGVTNRNLTRVVVTDNLERIIRCRRVDKSGQPIGPELRFPLQAFVDTWEHYQALCDQEAAAEEIRRHRARTDAWRQVIRERVGDDSNLPNWARTGSNDNGNMRVEDLAILLEVAYTRGKLDR